MPMHPMYQGTNAYHQNVPTPTQGVSVRPFNPAEFQQGQGFYNPNFMQMPPIRTNRFGELPTFQTQNQPQDQGQGQNQGTNLQNLNNPYDVAFNVKRHRQDANTPDDEYGGKIRKQQHK